MGVTGRELLEFPGRIKHSSPGWFGFLARFGNVLTLIMFLALLLMSSADVTPFIKNYQSVLFLCF